jgi:WD40 repeat protein
LKTIASTLMLSFSATVLFAATALGQDPAQVKFRIRLADPADHVKVTVFSPDGSKILLVCEKSTQVWSVETGKLLVTFRQNIDLNDGFRFEWQPAGEKLLQFPFIEGKQAYLWDTTDGRLLAAMSEKGGVTNASWNRDGTRILVVGKPLDGHYLNKRRSNYSIRDAAGGLIRSGFTEGKYALSTRFAADGRHLIINTDAPSGEKPIRILEADTGRLVGWFDQDVANDGYARFVSQSPDDRYICAEIEDSKRTACWGSLSQPSPIFYLLDNKQTGNINFLSFSPRSDRFAVAKQKQKVIEIVDAANGKTVSTLNNPSNARVQFYPLWNGPPPDYTTIGDSWSPDGRYFIASDIEKNAFIWDAENGRLIATIPLSYHRSSDLFVGTFAIGFERFFFQPSGKILMSVNRETVKLWDPATGKLLQQIRDASFDKREGWSQDETAKWNPDGRSFVTTTDQNRTVIVWAIN